MRGGLSDRDRRADLGAAAASGTRSAPRQCGRSARSPDRKARSRDHLSATGADGADSHHARAFGFLRAALALHAAEGPAAHPRSPGHQYWWEIEYDHPDPSQRLRTANELHIPTGKPVELVLTSRDVIHSFWLPSISGKKDLDSRTHEHRSAHRRQAGLVHRAMRGVLRPAARQDATRAARGHAR